MSKPSMNMATRFNLLNATLVLVTALSVGFIATYMQLTRQFEARQQHSQALAMMLAETSEYAVFTGQGKLLEYQLEHLRKVPGLAYVVIFDAQGRQLARMSVDSLSESAPVEAAGKQPESFWNWWKASRRHSVLEIIQPITSGGFQNEDALFLQTSASSGAIGEVRLAMNMDDFVAVVRHAIQWGLLVVAMILLIGLTISLTLTARIASPLKQLAAAAHQLTDGHIQPVTLESGGPEVRELVQAFNLMVSWLSDYRAEVESYQAMLERQAFYDELTGLANRTLLKDHLQLALSQSHRRQSSMALLFLDLDRFKYVNDTLGHSFGDLLLQEVSTRLRNAVRGGDTVGRMGGDEFVIIVDDLNPELSQAREDVALVAEQIGSVLHTPFSIRGHEISTSFSIGIALCPHDGDDSEALIRYADCAMYDAKTQGRNTYRFYEPALQQLGARRLNLESGLKRAQELGELTLNFQPKYDCTRKCLIGAEALLRWQHKDEWISPTEFIPLAEETGLILPIGEWVMETALNTLVAWRQQGLVDSDFHIGVNVSPAQFWHHEFAERTLTILQRCLPEGQGPGVLELELTESCLLRPSEESRKTFNALRKAGVRFAVDDFGTGYSNLSYLKQFPLDVLKIDQSFVRDCIEDLSDATIIRAIIAMAHGLGLAVIAEGVETFEHAEFLKQAGCKLLQGYLVARPMPAEQFGDFCRELPQHPLLSIESRAVR
ncbi:putative bifunctional diguanylate cyclase/phosphodiesterase [Methylomonas albis]|uniref:EAL domain-containing protein n=1 Tax=Methylomonas albis TaxID=1854563 RepID=A0ABR9CWR4_9GAMM|nr:EAL domain-containing protein [Methylomonas albis]MBD9354956.1 EAL domain-containing protein [Methylomonas albis]